MGDFEPEHGHSDFADYHPDRGAAREEHAEAAPSQVITTRRLRDREQLKKRKVEASENEQFQEEARGKRQRKGKGTGTGRGRRRGKEPEPEPEPELEPEPEPEAEAAEAEVSQATEGTEHEPYAVEGHEFVAATQHEVETEDPQDNYTLSTDIFWCFLEKCNINNCCCFHCDCGNYNSLGLTIISAKVTYFRGRQRWEKRHYGKKRMQELKNDKLN